MTLLKADDDINRCQGHMRIAGLDQVSQEVNDLLNNTGPSKRREKKIWMTLPERRDRP